MFIFAPIKKDWESKVRSSQHIRTEHETKLDGDSVKPSEPAKPEQPEAK